MMDETPASRDTPVPKMISDDRLPAWRLTFDLFFKINQNMDRRREYPGTSSSLHNPLIQDRMAVLVAELHYPIQAKHNAIDLSVFGKDVIH